MNVKNEPRAFDHYSNGLITHHTSSSSSHSSSSALSTLWNKTTTITMRSREHPEISSSKIPIVSPIIDLDHRLHRLLAFGLFFLFVVFVLVLMSKIYKTVKLLKYRSKHFGYYINPKYETILVNLNRQIRAGSRTLAQNFKKRQFVRVRKYDDDEYDDYDIDGNEKQAKTTKQDSEYSVSTIKEASNNWGVGGYVNEVFELTESSEFDSNSRRSSQETIQEEEEEEIEGNERLSKKVLVQNLLKNGRLRSSFNYKRLAASSNRNRTGKKSRSTRTKRASKMCSYIVKKVLSAATADERRKTKKVASSSIANSEAPSTVSTSITNRSLMMVEFNLPVILVTDTSSMNTIIIDLDEDDEFR